MKKGPNIWRTVWTEPRETISRLVMNPLARKTFWALAAVYGFCSIMNLFQAASAGFALSTFEMILASVIIAPVWGYIVFSFWSWVVTLVGRWFNGKGSFAQIRTAYAISCVPMAVTAALWLFMVLLFGQELFMSFPDAFLLTNVQLAVIFAILLSKVVLAVWSLVIYINALSEVQQYSVLRTILTIITAGIIVFAASWVLWTLAVNFSSVIEKSPTAFMILHDGLEIVRKGT
jgi:hypothetical protein